MSYDEMVEKRRLDAIDAEEAAERKEAQRLADAEHAVSAMLYDDPEALMAVFHDNATDDDLDAMDGALVKYLKGVCENEESPLYDAIVRIFKETN